MKEIQLTLGQVALVDDEDFEYLNLWKWTAQWNECVQGYYAVRNEGTKRILMHRIVSKAPRGMLCDHIHHNTTIEKMN